jgi:DNA-binding NarL/FixJ family response regulator
VNRPTVRLLLADGQPLLRTGFRTVLGAEDGLTVVGEAGDGVQAVELTRRLLPDVVVFDLALPRLDGVGLARAIAAAGLPVRLLALAADLEVALGADLASTLRADLASAVGRAPSRTDEPDPARRNRSDTDAPAGVAVLRAGAAGLLAKDVPGADLVAAIRSVAAGQCVLAPAVLGRVLAGPPAESPAGRLPRDYDELTDREREVLVLVGRGRSNAEIAIELGVGETTVKTHVGRVLTKLGLRDRVAAVVLVHEHGLLPRP